jgi:TonB family protein
LQNKSCLSVWNLWPLASLKKPNRQMMIRLLIYGGLIALFACTTKPGIEEPTTVTSLPEPAINTSFPSDCTSVLSQAVRKILNEKKPKRVSHPKAQTYITKNFPNSLTIKAIFKEFDTKPFQEHKIMGSTDTTIYLQEGTIIKIPSNAFIIEKTGQKPRGKVRLLFKEYYSLSDILLANLTTTTKTETLETGGMIYINASSGSDTLALEKEIEISFPFTEKVEDMQLFTGERDTSDVLVWEIPLAEESDLETDDETGVIGIVEQMPVFPGGYESFVQFLRANIKYPSEARRKGLEGTVYVSIVIDADGDAGEKKVLKGLDKILDQAALDAFGNMPAWKPGKVAGKTLV